MDEYFQKKHWLSTSHDSTDLLDNATKIMKELLTKEVIAFYITQKTKGDKLLFKSTELYDVILGKK